MQVTTITLNAEATGLALTITLLVVAASTIYLKSIFSRIKQLKKENEPWILN